MRTWGRLVVGLSVILMSLASSTPAGANTIAGVTCSGINDLQSALGAANPGDTIQLLSTDHCAGIAYSFSPGHVPVTLDGNGATLDGNLIVPTGTLPILSGADVGDTTIENLTFVNGSLTSGSGAAIDLTGNSSPSLINDRFYNNSAGDFGGAVSINTSASGGTITVSGSTFGSATGPNSSGTAGGGLSIVGAGAGQGTPTVALSNDSFIDNHASSGAGGFAFSATGGNGQISIANSTFAGNSSRYGGSGASLGFEQLSPGIVPHATLTGNRFLGNIAQSDSNFAEGAGLAVIGALDGTGSLVQQNNLFQGNRIPKTTDASTNSFYGNGGGEWDDFMPITSTGDRFIANSITAKTAADTIWGAGLSVSGCGVGMPALLTNDVIAGNTSSQPAAAEGTGLYVGAVCKITGSTVALALRDSTISGNTAPGGTAGVYGEAADTLNASNSIIAGNPGGSTDIGGFATRSLDHSDACASGVAPSGIGNFCAAPKLLNAAAGDVHETSASPTIDKGVNAEVPTGLTTDVYGSPRITDGLGSGAAIVDIGAAESPPKAPPPPPKPACVVPKLKGLSLKAARRALTKAHCALGKIHRRRHRKHAKLVVLAQSRRPHTRLPNGTKVGITLGPKRKARHHH